MTVADIRTCFRVVELFVLLQLYSIAVLAFLALELVVESFGMGDEVLLVVGFPGSQCSALR